MFIWWSLKVGLGINCQITMGIFVMSKAPLPPPQYHAHHLPQIFHDLFGTKDPSGVHITNVLLPLLHFIKLSYKKTESTIPKKSMYLAHHYL